MTLMVRTTHCYSSIVALCWLLLLFSHSVAASTNSDELRFGSVAMDIPAIMQKRLLPLTKYLSNILGQPVVL
ncbi:MAG TPA: hypothetical protein VIM41_08250, partial [Gammaproteobacteria bacterium]